jgi:hypothetical protein
MDMSFVTWNVRSLYRADSLTAAARELARYKLDLVGFHELSWDKAGTVIAGVIIFSMKKERKSPLGNRIFVHCRTVSAFERVDFVCDSSSCIVLRGHWCNIIVMNVHAPSEEKSGDPKEYLYEEVEQVFYHFPKYI